jgi:hypothetical protein
MAGHGRVLLLCCCAVLQAMLSELDAQAAADRQQLAALKAEVMGGALQGSLRRQLQQE